MTTATGHRWLENAGFAVAVLIGATYGLAEALAHLGFRLGPCAGETGLPWGLVVFQLALVLPKTVGRGTAGAIWRILAGRGVGNGSARPPEDDPPTNGAAI